MFAPPDDRYARQLEGCALEPGIGFPDVIALGEPLPEVTERIGRGAEDPGQPFVYRYDRGPWQLHVHTAPDDELGLHVVVALLITGEGAPPLAGQVEVGDPLTAVEEAFPSATQERRAGALVFHDPSLRSMVTVCDGEVDCLSVYLPPKRLPVFLRKQVRANRLVSIDEGVSAPTSVPDPDAPPHPLFPSAVPVKNVAPPPPALGSWEGLDEPRVRLAVPRGWSRRASSDEVTWIGPFGHEQVRLRRQRGSSLSEALAELPDNLLPPEQRQLPGGLAARWGGDAGAAGRWQRPIEGSDLALRHFVLLVEYRGDVFEVDVARRVQGATACPDGEALARGVFLSLRLGDVGERRVSENGLRRIYRALCNLAACDGEVDPSEQRLLDAYCEEHGIGAAEASELEGEGRRGERLDVGKNPDERALMLECMIDVAAADGVLDPQELKRLRRLSKVMGIDKEELTEAIRARWSTSAPSNATRQADTGATLVLLDLDPAAALHFDEISTLIRDLPEGFQGFLEVPAGVHWVACADPELRQAPGRWFVAQAGAVVVLELRGGRLRRPDPERAKRFRERATRGALDGLIAYPREFNPCWRELTTPLRNGRLPGLSPREAEAPEQSRLEAIWFGTHEGDADALLAEVSYAFLAGWTEKREEGIERWLHLLQSVYHCGEHLPQRDPPLFVALARLIGAQWLALPDALLLDERSPVVFGSRYLSEDLIDTEVPALVEAGRRFEQIRSARLASARGDAG